MYIPRHFRWKDKQQVWEFIRKYPFALLVSANGAPVATHLPFVARVDGEKVRLLSHMAAENPQSAQLDGQEVLVVFQHPHAYIAPAWYESTMNVPTWNYLAVHCYGICRVGRGRAAAEEGMLAFFEAFDPAYTSQYRSLPDAYKDKLHTALVSFEIEVMDVQAKAKMSQNKTGKERSRIIHELNEGGHAEARDLATWMKNLLSD